MTLPQHSLFSPARAAPAMVWQEIGVVAGGILLIGCFIYIGMSGNEISKRYAEDQELKKKIQSQRKRDDDGGDKGQDENSARRTTGSAQQRPNARGAGSSLAGVPEGDEEPGPGAGRSIPARSHPNGHTVQPSKTTPPTARPQLNGHTIPPSKNSPSKTATMPPPPVPRSPPRLKPPIFSSMPPPPRPISGPTTLRPPPSSASQLRVLPQQRLSNTSMKTSSLTSNKSASKSRAVTLTPGHSPLDWAALQSSGKLPSTTSPLLKITPTMLNSQTGRKGNAAWTEFRGKVYDVGPYLPFHPGGETELMKGAGRGAERFFMEVHPWVNWEGILGGCCVGVLVGEGEERNMLEEID